MVQAWYMEDAVGNDRHKPLQKNPPEPVTLDLLSKFGVNYWKIESPEHLEKIIKEGGYDYKDEIVCSREGLPNYDVMIEKFFEEHVHTDNETRLVLEGSGYFDVRDPRDDRWIRVFVEKNDMISVPSGLYHRFTTDEKNFIKAQRFFQGEPVWTPHNRSDGGHPCHQTYINKYANVNI